jgi:hypothetical protein
LTVFVLHKSKEQISMNTPSINPHKSRYKVRNRQAYNASLSKRGSLTLFISEELLKEWSSLVDKKKAAGEFTCPHIILQCCLPVRLNCHLPYRQSAGFLTGLLQLMGQGVLPVPDYTTLCRRQKSLPVEISHWLYHGENLVVGTDSTDLKVCGNGSGKYAGMAGAGAAHGVRTPLSGNLKRKTHPACSSDSTQ